jgi:type IV secretory pathway VirB2 component (pilin)
VLHAGAGSKACGSNIHQIRELLTGNMKTALSVVSVLLIVVGAALLFERPAYAYADPGSGLLAIQAAGSALVAAGWYLRRRIYLLFHRGEPKSHHEDLPSVSIGEDSSNT